MRIARGLRGLLGRRIARWLYQGHSRGGHAARPGDAERAAAPWWRVMCLTGVDYFSTLGYQPGIAFLAAGALSPAATLFLVFLTVFGALPIYRRVAEESPHGEGSIAMLEHLLPRWRGKLVVLCLLGFLATDFVITITLSAADATAHIIENPFTPAFLHGRLGVTFALVALLGALFLKGFREAMGLAVVLVVVYLTLNAVVVAVAAAEMFGHPSLLAEWGVAVLAGRGVVGTAVAAAVVFPRLALGLSGFETGVAVMPLVQGDSDDAPAHPAGRIRNTQRLLLTAALIMSVFLVSSSVVTTVLIPAEEFRAVDEAGPAGKANGRALAFLAHQYLGDVFGTVYDLSTIAILWLAGASAMAGLLTVVPRYLPRYGMAPEWARARRPLVLVITGICAVVTIVFDADVDAQGGAYATGVLAVMTSAAFAVTLAAFRRGERARWGFLAVAAVFVYTTVDNVIVRPEGIKIAACFIGGIVALSMVSRAWRSTEVRVTRVRLDAAAARALAELGRSQDIRILANHPDRGDPQEYESEGRVKLESHHLPLDTPVAFLEVTVTDASTFSGDVQVRGVLVGPHRVFRAEGAAVPNVIAAFLLHVRSATGKIPHVYFGWTEGNPFLYLLKYVALGEGETAPVTREILRQAEPEPARRPIVHVA